MIEKGLIEKMQNRIRKISNKEYTLEQIKDTGVSLAIILLITSLIYNKIILVKIAIALLILNITIPKIYKPVAVILFSISHLLGIIISKIILTAVFFAVVTPMGVIRKMCKIDSLKLNQFKKDKKSVMVTRNWKFTKKDIENPY